MAESLSAQFLPDKNFTLPSGRKVVLKSIDPVKAAALLPPEMSQAAPDALKKLIVSAATEDLGFLRDLIRFLLSEGVAEPQIVPKVAVDDLGPGEIRFQDVGEDLPALLGAVARYNQYQDMLNVLGPR
jgi:hypothetical protein